MSEHPHYGFTKLGHAVHLRALDHLPVHSAYARFNKAVAVKVTGGVGSMTCAWVFCLLALLSLPAVLTQAFHLHVFPSWLVAVGLIALVAWIAQTFLQLVLLSVIMVGQNVQQAASDARAAKTFEDCEMIAAILDLHTEGGLAVVLSEVKDARIAAETASEAMKMLTSVLGAKARRGKDLTMAIRTAAVASAQGLDVSDFQGQFDWQAARREVPGLAFGTFRLTQGLGGGGTVSPDPDAAWNHGQIAACGLHRGAYHFLDPKLDGAAQAGYFVAAFASLGLTRTDMLWLDNETAGSSPAAVAACARDFMAELDKLAPANPRGVYTFIDFARQGNCDGLSRYPLWLAYPAQAAPVPPPPWHLWTFWQWGLRNGSDADAFNGTAAQLSAWIASFAPKAGPYRHAADGHRTLGEIAAARNTTPAHILQVTAAALTAADLGDLARLPLPEGWPFYTTNP